MTAKNVSICTFLNVFLKWVVLFPTDIFSPLQLIKFNLLALIYNCSCLFKEWMVNFTAIEYSTHMGMVAFL